MRLRDRLGIRGALAALAVGALLFVDHRPALASAHETTVVRDGSVLAVTAAAGVDNDISLAVDGDAVLVADASTEVSAGSGCAPESAGEARCSLQGVSAVEVSLADGADRGTKRSPVPVLVEWDGGAGDEFFTAAAEPDGPDRYIGGQRVAAQVNYGLRTTAVALSNNGVADDGAPGEGDDIASEFNILFGGAGDDVIAAGSGNELFVGGGAGDDVIETGGGNDLVLESRGADAVRLGPGADRFSSNVSGSGADDVAGGEGFDTVSYGPRSRPQVVTIDGVADDGEAGEGDNVRLDVERVVGGGGGDRLTGSPGPDALLGASGDDVLDGGDGGDTEDGGEGDDTLGQRGHANGADTLIGGSGADTVDYSARANPVTATADGAPDDGEAGEGDNVGADIETIVLPATCPGLEAQPGTHLVGTAGDDTLRGTEGPDVICGLGGDDTIDAGAGDDVLAGNAGDDVLVGGRGDDRVVATLAPDGADDIRGGDGYDTMSYAARFDSVVADLDGAADDGGGFGLEGDNLRPDVEQLIGGLDNDVLAGSTLANRIVGGPGDDLFLSPSPDGADRYVGSAGFDELSYAGRASAVMVDLDAESDDGGLGESDNAAADIERVVGGSADDRLTGGPGANVLVGGPGHDQFRSPAVDGPDDYRGGVGIDTLDYAGRPAGVSVDVDGVADDGAGGEGDNARIDVERLAGTSHADALIGSAADNVLLGRTGDDELLGGDGDDVFAALPFVDGADVIDGGFGVDLASYATREGGVTVSINNSANDGADGGREGDNVRANVENVTGGSGDDTIVASGAFAALDNRFVGGSGHDDLDGRHGDDVLDGGSGDDAITGGVGVDRLSGGADRDSLHGGFGQDELSGGDGDDLLSGDADRDALNGDAGADFVQAGAGHDTLDGGTGDDVLHGDAGDDVVEGGRGNDRIRATGEVDGDDDYRGGPGRDLVSYAARTGGVHVSVDDLAGDGAYNPEQPLDRRLEFDNIRRDVEIVDGGHGDDFLFGSNGGPTHTDRNELYGMGGDDRINGIWGDDVLDGGDGDDVLLDQVGGDDDILRGGDGGDDLYGGDGQDRLSGGAGHDRLFGRPGDDRLDGGEGFDRLDGEAGVDACATGEIVTNCER